MYYISCNLCGKDETKIILKQPNSEYFPRTIVRCLNCGLVYMNPQPEYKELLKIYQENSSEDISSPSPEKVIPEELLYPYPPNIRIPLRLSFLKKMMKPGKLLDVGCASGEFLHYAKLAGWEGEGIEPSFVIADITHKKTGLPIYRGTLEDFSEKEEIFDLITMFDVIEHVADPKTDIKRAYQLLKINGMIAISTPNIGCQRYWMQKDKWRGFTESREHIFFFSARTLSDLLIKCGFKIKRRLTRKISPVLWRWLVYFGLGNVLEIYAQKI